MTNQDFRVIQGVETKLKNASSGIESTLRANEDRNQTVSDSEKIEQLTEINKDLVTLITRVNELLYGEN